MTFSWSADRHGSICRLRLFSKRAWLQNVTMSNRLLYDPSLTTAARLRSESGFFETGCLQDMAPCLLGQYMHSMRKQHMQESSQELTLKPVQGFRLQETSAFLCRCGALQALVCATCVAWGGRLSYRICRTGRTKTTRGGACGSLAASC